jgi:hypothetical protein
VKKVTKAEWKAFIESYPRPLVSDVARMCEPPMLNHNDFSNGKVWPESMVAKVHLEHYDYKTGIIGENNNFWIKELAK